ncbi:uncharacterized protein LOC143414091 [Maylandia zebra]|uniref:uncharacterized protein LOC143414091 n=1 Tax=Maylandia zebra TaxID=106582 RepID=UPI00403CDFE8
MVPIQPEQKPAPTRVVVLVPAPHVDLSGYWWMNKRVEPTGTMRVVDHLVVQHWGPPVRHFYGHFHRDVRGCVGLEVPLLSAQKTLRLCRVPVWMWTLHLSSQSSVWRRT